MSFLDFWVSATRDSSRPFPYQERLAAAPWPDLLRVPTGLGKTAGVVLAWLYKRLRGDPGTPRRLVYCLPMRALVEQTAASARDWLRNLGAAGIGDRAKMPAEPHVLMGGETDDEWIRHPEKPAILIGTQDILLSRALMRGYGVGRARWPVDFALLHNDAMWVFDEVQLMAGGIATSAQLEAFRQCPEIGTVAGCRSLWMSATLERDWLSTVDFGIGSLVQCGLEADDRSQGIARQRLEAKKTIARARVAVTPHVLTSKGLRDYAEALAAEILEQHRPGRTTLVIVNRVDRAQALYDALGRRRPSPALLLVHSRFRPAERRRLTQQLVGDAPDGRIVVATQAVEAGVDMTSAVMFTELAPWASLVQRLGRLNRAGEEGESRAFWIDIATDDAKSAELALPYAAQALDAARDRLRAIEDASPAALERFDLALDAPGQVLRRRDLYQLFDTDADLTGFDVDVSPYIRGAEDASVRVFWRKLAEMKEGWERREAQPGREEICAIPIGPARRWLEKKENRGRAFVWDWVEGQWARLDRLWPEALVLVDAALGGYDETRGFDAESTVAVSPVEGGRAEDAPPEGFDDDSMSGGPPVPLPDHLRRVQGFARDLCHALHEPDAGLRLTDAERDAVVTAALWHDLGKAHDVFKARCGLAVDDAPLAKAPGYNWRVRDRRNRKHFRHELASALAWLERGPQGETHDLVAYLIAAHHGKVRMGLRALPDEPGPKDGADRLFARGVWDGDELPAIAADGLALPATRLSLDLMRIGGANGRSWATRTQGLLQRYGPFRLAFLEALLRIADWRASAEERRLGADNGGKDG
jgi:CRISPR-associated endonuclease/helicase Cas3